MKAYEAVARAVVDEGVDVVFTLLGDANMELIGTLDAFGTVSVRHNKHESATVAEAEGYALASGRPAFCAVTSGPGLGNAVVSLTEASRTGAPVVLFSGQASRDDRNNIQNFDHRAVASLCGAHYSPAGSAGGVLDAVREAFYVARTRSVPVLLDIDIDIQHADLPWAYEYEPSHSSIGTAQRSSPDPDVLGAIAECLDRSSNPIFIAGRGAVASGAAESIASLATEVGALLATTLPVRGLFHGHPANIGVAGVFSRSRTTECFGKADCVVAFGASLNYYTTEGGYLFGDADVVHIDVKPNRASSSARSSDLNLVADAKVAAEALHQLMRDRPNKPRHVDTQPPQFDNIVEAGQRFSDGVDPRHVVQALERSLPDDVGLVTGSGHFTGIAIMEMSRHYDPQLFTYQFGAIGQALPVGIGAAAAFPERPIVIVEGDGSVMMNVAELEVLARYRPHVLLVIMNDGALGAEFHKLRAKGFSPDPSLMFGTDLADLARVFGCTSAVVTDAAEIPGHVARFLESDGPMVLDCRVTREVVSIPYRRIHFGLE